MAEPCLLTFMRLHCFGKFRRRESLSWSAFQNQEDSCSYSEESGGEKSYLHAVQSTSFQITFVLFAPISSLTPSPNPIALGSQFSFTIQGTNFDPSTAQVYVMGPGCPTSTSCVIPTNVMTSKTNATIVGPADDFQPRHVQFLCAERLGRHSLQSSQSGCTIEAITPPGVTL